VSKKKPKATSAARKPVASKKAASKKATAKKTSSKKVTKKKVTKNKAGKKKVVEKKVTKKATTQRKTTPKKKTSRTNGAVVPSKPKPRRITKPTRVPTPYASVQRDPDALDLDAMEPPTVAKLKRTKSGLSRKELAFLKQELLVRRSEIKGDLESLGSDASGSAGGLSNMPVHMADVGTDNYERENTLGLMESEAKVLREIDQALIRMRDGYYGLCLLTGEPIGFGRLEFKPWAKYCIEVAREREKRGIK
jgi:RNA polymerase-binding transcription factor DksA